MRQNNWQTLLSNAIEAAKERKFEWGTHDCCLFPCDCILAMTGEDPAKPFFRGKYSTEKEAYKLLKIHSGGGVAESAELICMEMGFEEIEPNFAQRGDVVLCRHADMDMLGIIDLNGSRVLIATESGILRHGTEVIKRAWRV